MISILKQSSVGNQSPINEVSCSKMVKFKIANGEFQVAKHFKVNMQLGIRKKSIF